MTRRSQVGLLRRKRSAAQEADIARLLADFRPWCANRGIPQNFTDEEMTIAYLWLECDDAWDNDADDGLPDDLIQTVGDFIMGR